jgi:hypothetical protein
LWRVWEWHMRMACVSLMFDIIDQMSWVESR